MDWVWMRNYMEGMMHFWNAVYYGGLNGWSVGDGEIEDSGA